MNDAVSLEVIDPNDHSQAARLDRICRELGFFRIPADSVPPGVAEAAWTEGTRFFSQPIELKNSVAFPHPGYPYGYSPFQFETLAASLGDRAAAPDLKESYSVGPDCLGPDHRPPSAVDLYTNADPEIETVPDEAWIWSPSRWPVTQPTLQPAWEELFRALSDVSAELLSIMAEALELPRDYFAPLIDRHGSAMRALHYPALAETPSAGSLRAGAHSDYGTVTILMTDDVPGLEVQQPDGSWRAVVHVPDTYVVNLGDSIAQWTNDRWRSTVHRVTTVSPAERHSLAFFHMANWDAVIECLPTCHSESNPPRYPPVEAGPWLMDKFTRSVE